MSPLALRLLERAHGHLGVLAAAALFHPGLLLRRRRSGGLTSAAAATFLTTLTGALGLAIYPSYRETVKPILFARSSAVGWAFERKEHLGVAAVLLSWAGLAAFWADVPRTRSTPTAPDRTAQLAYLAAAVASTIVALLGVWVASHATFGSSAADQLAR